MNCPPAPATVGKIESCKFTLFELRAESADRRISGIANSAGGMLVNAALARYPHSKLSSVRVISLFATTAPANPPAIATEKIATVAEFDNVVYFDWLVPLINTPAIAPYGAANTYLAIREHLLVRSGKGIGTCLSPPFFHGQKNILTLPVRAMMPRVPAVATGTTMARACRRWLRGGAWLRATAGEV